MAQLLPLYTCENVWNVK